VEVVELLTPCNLHLENRVSKKYYHASSKKVSTFMVIAGRKTLLSHTFHTEVFGTEDSPSQWKLRCTKDSGSLSLEVIQLWIKAMHGCLTVTNVIIECSIPQHDALASDLIIAPSKYKKALEIFTLPCEPSEDHREFSNTD
jgi:hypothetical protein